jgi:hypothetical protein
VVKGLHNRLGEHGEALTVLSLLQGEPLLLHEDAAGTLGDISQRLRDLVGDDTEVVAMYSVVPGADGDSQFSSLEHVPLREAMARLHQVAGGGDDALTVLSVLDQTTEFDDSGPVSQAFSSLREALRGLFNRAGENGQQLTVLSLLSQTRPATPPES